MVWLIGALTIAALEALLIAWLLWCCWRWRAALTRCQDTLAELLRQIAAGPPQKGISEP